MSRKKCHEKNVMKKMSRKTVTKKCQKKMSRKTVTKKCHEKNVTKKNVTKKNVTKKNVTKKNVTKKMSRKKIPRNTPSHFLIFTYSFTGYIGLQFVLALVRTFGAFLAVTITTCRKALTIIISFMFFSKPFTFQYVWSGMLVVLGLILMTYSKHLREQHILPIFKNDLKF